MKWSAIGKLLLTASLLQAGGARAQDSAVPLAGPVARQPSEAELDAAHRAELRGAEMFRYDQAAWHVTDRYVQDVKAARVDLQKWREQGLKGYLVEPAQGSALLVTFYGEDGAGRWAFARYTYADEGRVEGGLLRSTDREPLSPLANRLADARRVALAEFAKPGHDLCSGSTANSLVLPTADGGVAVYVLTSTTDASVYPAGGHFRFDFDGSGRLIGERRFMKGCMPLSWAERDGKRPEAVFLSHLLDPQPTEIHAFVSRNIPVPMLIVTVENRDIWAAYRGDVRFVKVLEPRKQ